MGYKSKDDFYLEIEDDYKENRTESFIFKFIKKKKDLQIEAGKLSPKRNSRYMLLQSLYKEYKKSGKSGAELTGFLTDSLRELSLDELKEIMPGHGDKTTKKVLLVDAGKKIRSEFGSKKLPENGAVIRLVELLGSKYLDADIKNFFYEIGLNKNKSGGRRKDEGLDMLFGFLDHKGERAENIEERSTALSAEQRLEDESFIRECTELFDLLNDMEVKDVNAIFVPILIDPDTGLGIYIAGGDILEKEKTEKGGNNCYYCCIRFDYDTGFGEIVTENEHRLKMSYLIENEGYRYDDINEAIKEYHLLKNKYMDYDGYTGINEGFTKKIKNKDVERFLRFFVPRDEFGDVMEEREKALRRHRFKRDAARNKKEEMKRKRH